MWRTIAPFHLGSPKTERDAGGGMEHAGKGWGGTLPTRELEQILLFDSVEGE